MDLDKLLRDSLKATGEGYRPAHEADARREFLRRARKRRIYLGGSFAFAAAAAAAVVLFFVTAPTSTDRPGDERDNAGIASTSVTAMIDVGRRPVAVVVGHDFVWVANAGDQSVVKVDPSTNEVEETYPVDGTPAELEVAGGYVWVALEDQPRLVSIRIDDGAIDELPLNGGGTDLDMASGGQDLWVVSSDTPLQRIDTSDFTPIPQDTAVGDPVDVAVGHGKVWLLGTTGRIERLDQNTGLSEGIIPLDAPVSPTASDLLADDTGLWASDGDSRTIFRVDIQTGALTTEVAFNGSSAELAADPGGRVWVLVASASDSGSVKLISSATGAAEEGEIRLGGHPADLRFGAGALWVVGGSSGRLTRIEHSPGSPLPSPLQEGQIADDVVVYLYADGEVIWSVLGEARVERVTSTAEIADNPSYFSDDTIVFERVDASGMTTIVSRNLTTGVEETTPISGSEVAVGPDEKVAWVPPKSDQSEQTRIRIGSLDGSGQNVLVGNPDFDPLAVRNLEWGSGAEKLYYEAGTNSFGLYELDVATGIPRSIDPPEDEAAYLAPSVTDDGALVVIKVCCRKGGYETAELGMITFDDDRPEYRKIRGLDDAGFHPDSDGLIVEYAAGLDVESNNEGRRWSETPIRAWFVGDGNDLWLIDEAGEVDGVIPNQITGVSVNPQLRD
ncbi:MAG: hypothetical protein ACRDJB_02225 [Actinomycetota bacterium]